MACLSTYRRYPLVVALFAALNLSSPVAMSRAAAGNQSEERVCDPLADYFLGMEDYQEAIRRHLIVVERRPDNALAHYHLGFAYGLTGRHHQELDEYKKAIDLGLSDWELFLNLGLLYLEGEHLSAATDVLRLCTMLAPWRSETHFNLGLAFERRAMLPQAEQEMLLALRLDPGQPDARNTLGVIYAEQGNYARAREEWTDLIRSNPDYEPARRNLAILGRVEHGESKPARGATAFARP